MGESTQGQLGQLLNYGRLSAIHPLKMPRIEKKDIPDYITCPKYEKAMDKLNQKMERYQGKVDRCEDDIRQLDADIAQMNREYDKWHSKGHPIFGVNENNVNAVNDARAKANHLVDLLEKANDKRNDLIDKRTEAIEEAEERLQELTLEALTVLDDDIVTALDRCTQIVSTQIGSESVSSLLEAMEICLIELRIFALFEDMIEGNSQRNDARAHIAEVNRHFASMCDNEQVKNYIVDMYQRNQGLVQKNADIFEETKQVLDSIDQGQLTKLTQPLDAVLGESFNTSFSYQHIVDPTELDAVIVQINKTIGALKQNIADANGAVAAANDFAKTAEGVDQQAKTLLSSMRANVDDMKNEIISQSHFTLQLIDEGVIEDFYHRDVRPATTALRQHLVGAIGEDEINYLVSGDSDRFSLEKAENTIKKANLLRLKSAISRVPAHINRINELIATAEKDISEANKVPQQKADALNKELSGKYIQTCLPLIGMFAAGNIKGQVTAFESAFRSTNQIYQNLATALLEKNGKLAKAVMIIGTILGIGGIAAFFVLDIGGSVAINAGVPGGVFLLYAITALQLSAVGKRLRSYLQR
ncbi:MAG: hypothetical protein LBI54_00870 [Lachnospiraceae bacterium]|jgi:glutaredoxin 2|nr:hypothetical protein [Lachnospiraceae bacterium]